MDEIIASISNVLGLLYDLSVGMLDILREHFTQKSRSRDDVVGDIPCIRRN
jgi:hypothetical protein